jgi:hypothetical protein
MKTYDAVMAFRLGQSIFKGQVRIRPLLRFTDEWSACMSRLDKLARHNPVNECPSARVEAFRSYPILLLSEYVPGGPSSSFEKFLPKESNPFVPAGVEALLTPRAGSEQVCFLNFLLLM